MSATLSPSWAPHALRAVSFGAIPVMLAAGAAQAATTVNITNAALYDPSALSGHFTLRSPAAGNPILAEYNPAPAGRFRLTIEGVASDVFAYCGDLLTATGTGLFTKQDANAVYDPGRVTNLLALLGNTAQPLTPSQSTALQLAVWEFIYDDGLDVTSGLFSSATSSVAGSADLTSTHALANSYLANVRNGTWTPIANTQLAAYTRIGSQTFVSMDAVPEPATWMMMIGGFAMVGGVMRRRRRETSRRSGSATGRSWMASNAGFGTVHAQLHRRVRVDFAFG